MVDEPKIEGGRIPLNEPTEPNEPEEKKEEVQQPSESDTPPKSEAEKPKGESNELKTLKAQKKHWREKYDKLNKSKEESKDKPKTSLSDDEWRTKTDFLLTHNEKKYSPAEFDHISTIAKDKGVTLDEAAEKAEEYIQYQREKVVNSNKVPNSDSALGVSGKSDKEIGDMSDAEHEAYWKKQNEKRGTSI